MRHHKVFGPGILFAMVVCTVFASAAWSAGVPVETSRHVVAGNEIQAQIDLQAGRADADRQAIQLMLQRDDVLRMAGVAGLDLERASAAAALLSGTSLEAMASQARAVNNGLVGGDGSVTMSTTVIIIVLLVLILLAT